MTAEASLHPASATQRQPRRSSLALWAAVLTLLAALIGAGVCMTITLPDISPVIGLVH